MRGQCRASNLLSFTIEPTVGPGSPQLPQEPGPALWLLETRPQQEGLLGKGDRLGSRGLGRGQLVNVIGRSKAEPDLLTARPGLVSCPPRAREVRPEGGVRNSRVCGYLNRVTRLGAQSGTGPS